MDTSLFDYDLPTDRIAQKPIEPRDRAKLLVIRRESEAFEDRHIFNLPDLLEPRDLLIFNDSKVFKARLQAKKGEREFEVFLLQPLRIPLVEESRGEPRRDHWLALLQPAKKLLPGDELTLSDGSRLRLIKKYSDGTVLLDFGRPADEVFALTDRIGEVPVPPYVKTKVDDLSVYQTVYAKEIGSVAAPTAGFHFTPELLARLDARGIRKAFVTLHVGLGTFRPMKTATLEEHAMHEEWTRVPAETLQAIKETRKAGGRVIAVGTTTVRALESAAATDPTREFSGPTRLFITPGYHFKMIDGLLTNFHLPKSTLLVLVSALATRERILSAYQHAIENDYRFYSFGDAMLIL